MGAAAEATKAWNRSATYEFGGETICWGRSHQVLFEAIYQAAAAGANSLGSIFFWVASHDAKQIEISLSNWLGGADRVGMMKNAVLCEIPGDIEALADLAERVQEDISASSNEPEGGQDGEAPPGK